MNASRLSGSLAGRVQQTAGEGSSAGDATGHLPSAARDLYVQEVAHATHLIFLTGVCIALVALAAAAFIEETPLRGKPAAPAPVTP
ncbi:hypothetical protein [Kribbella sp. DT2]|uniref:hypothetical protein n=1 Tax=Kribbella sp. DT2 TaxID=3393427 RepID=UPI003CF921F2